MVITGLLIAGGVKIQVKFSGVKAHQDPDYFEDKFYRRPVHPGFITQRLPQLKSRIAVGKGRRSRGLTTAKEYRER